MILPSLLLVLRYEDKFKLPNLGFFFCNLGVLPARMSVHHLQRPEEGTQRLGPGIKGGRKCGEQPCGCWNPTARPLPLLLDRLLAPHSGCLACTAMHLYLLGHLPRLLVLSTNITHAIFKNSEYKKKKKFKILFLKVKQSRW